MAWPDIWTDLDPSEPLILDDRQCDTFGVGRARNGWPEVCRWASSHLPGQWWPKDRGLTWSNGSRHLWLVEAGEVDKIMHARRCVAGLGLQCGWSVGSAARVLLKYIGPPQRPESSSEGFLKGGGIGYHDCRPGRYSNGTLWDMRSAYFSLWQRLPCLRVTLRAGRRLIWHQEQPGERDRRETVAKLVADHKSLRNSLWGCSLGRERGAAYWCNGKLCSHPGGPGPFCGAARLIGRSVWELCREASEEVQSVYSHTDSVLSLDGLYPSCWDAHGLGVDVKGEGDADVRAPGIYRIGGTATYWYQTTGVYQETVPRPARPAVAWSGHWLRSA